MKKLAVRTGIKAGGMVANPLHQNANIESH